MIEREALFLRTADGPRFAMVTRPKSKPKGAWLYIHPFAEEMNKSRRMVALAAAAFAERGWAVLQVDLKGCGDSDGDFGEATWQDWVDDISFFWQWMERNCEGTQGLWTLRGGCLVVADWLKRQRASHPLLLWQPTVSGERHLTQFLRLQVVNQVLNESDARGSMKRLRADLTTGRVIEVAGYRLHPSMAAGLASARLELDSEFSSAVDLLEVASDERLELSSSSSSIVTKWRETNPAVHSEVVNGPAFWQTLEIETAPALISASLRSLERRATS
jgi:exosortase A-associated hydrolase 2